MNIKLLAVVTGLLFVGSLTFGINDSIPEVLMYARINTPYIRYHAVPREQVYIHFNKSSYLPGDNIWFTAYVFDPSSGLQSKLTTNLYIELYDP